MNPITNQFQQTATGNDRSDGFGKLVYGILQDAQTLISKEIASAKLELKDELAKGISAGISFGIGGFLLAMGAILLSLMLVFLLTTYTTVPLWGSLGIFGLVYCVVGAIFMMVGKKKADIKPYPEKTVEHTKEDVRYITERAKGH
jgi:VIT1/CCC1 family predicted Fe2+/Mn2+ transporter